MGYMVWCFGLGFKIPGFVWGLRGHLAEVDFALVLQLIEFQRRCLHEKERGCECARERKRGRVKQREREREGGREGEREREREREGERAGESTACHAPNPVSVWPPWAPPTLCQCGHPLGWQISGNTENGIQTPMAPDQSTKIIWITTSRLSIMNSLSCHPVRPKPCVSMVTLGADGSRTKPSRRLKHQNAPGG